MPRDIVVIGTSAGGVEALKTLVRGLPADLPAAFLVVLHVGVGSTSLLHDILNYNGALRAQRAVDGEPIRYGHIYVAQPDMHLLVEDGRMRLRRGPRENRARPAVDALFRTASRAHGPRVIGVILTGAMTDGTAGLLAVKRQGGVTVVQDPADALFPSMPSSALEYVEVDYVLPMADISATLVRLIRESAGDAAASAGPDVETKVAAMANDLVDTEKDYAEVGEPSPYSCPECNGVLWHISDPDILRFRCRVGHAYTEESLLTSQQDAIETALWEALRSLEESASMLRRMADRAGHRTARAEASQRFDERAGELEHHAGTLRRMLRDGYAGEGSLLP